MIADQRQGMEKFARSTGEPRDTGRSFSHGDCNGKEKNTHRWKPKLTTSRSWPSIGSKRNVTEVNLVETPDIVPFRFQLCQDQGNSSIFVRTILVAA